MSEHAGAWKLEIADRSFLVPASRGMPMLARLAASPHVEVHSLELVSGSIDPELDTGGDAGEMLDEKARAQYRKRIADLAEAIDDAEARGNVRRAEAARDEHEALVKELSRAVGLRGKVRRAGAAAERARVRGASQPARSDQEDHRARPRARCASRQGDPHGNVLRVPPVSGD